MGRSESGVGVEGERDTLSALAKGEHGGKDVDEQESKKDGMIWGDISAMVNIVKSPYEQNESAEVGETAFDLIKSLFVPTEEEEGVFSVSATSKKVFGSRLAESLAAAYLHIGKSGMLYSPAWQEGKIRGMQCGYIPKSYLLLCLHEQRFIKANDAVLSGVIKDLGTWKIVKDAMKEWKLENEYLNLASSSSCFVYQSQRSACCKCEVFVARARICVKALNRTKLDESLIEKIKTCLRIMDDHVKVNKRELEKLEAELEMQRTAKRPRFKKGDAGAESALDGPHTVSIENSSENASHNSIEPATLTKNKIKNDKKHQPTEQKRSLETLVEKFEKQYKEMGETLKALKQKIRHP
jgi:hypothetical protein